MILGLNVFHGDSSVVALGANGPAGLEEERLRREKHWAGFPAQALALLAAGDGLVEAAAVGRKPGAHLFSKALHALKGGTGLSAILERVRAVVCEAGPAGLQVDAKRAVWARFEPFDRRVRPLRVRTPPAHGRRDRARMATRGWALFVLDEWCRRHLG